MFFLLMLLLNVSIIVIIIISIRIIHNILIAFHGGSSTRNIFGMFNVPARIYPFVLLILLQVLIPGISF